MPWIKRCLEGRRRRTLISRVTARIFAVIALSILHPRNSANLTKRLLDFNTTKDRAEALPFPWQALHLGVLETTKTIQIRPASTISLPNLDSSHFRMHLRKEETRNVRMLAPPRNGILPFGNRRINNRRGQVSWRQEECRAPCNKVSCRQCLWSCRPDHQMRHPSP